jgi:hypothetical protein
MAKARAESLAGDGAGRGWVALGLVILGLAACDPRNNPAWTLGGEPGLLFAIKQYYELNALEQDVYICPNPLLEGVTHSRVTETDPGRLEVEIGYYYRDAHRDDDHCDQSGFGGCGGLRRCQGFAERSFVVVKDKDQLRVVEMSGPKRGTVWQPRPPAASPPGKPSP